MTDLEISKALALAIGWPERKLTLGCYHEGRRVLGIMAPDDETALRIFDYRDPAVIWPIAIHFNKFPWQEWKHGRYTGRWFVQMPDGPCTGTVEGDTAAKAVALAVIGAAS